MASEWKSIHDRDPILHQAAYIGDLEKVKSLLNDEKQKKIIDDRNRLGCTPLRLAATAGNHKCLQYLLWLGADPNIGDVKAQTPLFVAVKNQHITCIQLLLKFGADPDGDKHSLCSPLYIAAMDGYLPAVKELIKYEADINSAKFQLSTFSSTPLYISIAYHHFECFEELLHAGAYPGIDLPKSVKENKPNQPAKMNLLPQHKPVYQSLYHAAVKHNVEKEYVQLLYDCGASLFEKDDKGRFAFELNRKNECSQHIMELCCRVRSLQELARIVIRQILGRKCQANINDLPLPTKLKTYLRLK